MIRLNKLGVLKGFVVSLGAIPSSYMESLSYEEQILWICKYIDETLIPSINENKEAITELQGLYVQLKEYVDSYFENLDIQTEIDNKLDEMVESGTLEEIITAYLQLQGVLAYDTVSSMKEATNLIDGSYAKTYGYDSLNDGEGSFYKVRTIINTDVVDDKNIIALADEDLVAVRMIDNHIRAFNSVNELQSAKNIVEGEFIKTYGYYSSNDGGGACYKIRLKTIDDVTNNSTIIALTDLLLVAELVIDGSLNVKQFGAKGDGITDDTEAIQSAITMLRIYPRADEDHAELYFPNGEYKITDTIELKDTRFVKLYGKATIIGNIAKPLIKFDNAMYIDFNDLLIINQNTTTNSGCLYFTNSYVLSFNSAYFKGGDIVVNIDNGNDINFNNSSIINGRIGLYTKSGGNNTGNNFVNTQIEQASEYAIYVDFGNSYYGNYNFRGCYIECQSTEGVIYVKNRMIVTFEDCYINQKTENKYLFVLDGTTPQLRVKALNCLFTGTVGNVYFSKFLTSDLKIGVKVDKNCTFDSNVSLYNETDTYKSVIASINPELLNVYNLTWLKDTTNVLDTWLGSGTYTLTNTISADSLKSVSLSVGYIYKPVYLQKDVLYEIRAIAKNTGSGSAMIEIFNQDLNSRKMRIESALTTPTEIVGFYRPDESAIYNILVRNSSTTTAEFAGIKLYAHIL